MFLQTHTRTNVSAVVATLLASGLATACGSGSPSANASANPATSVILSLGLPHAANSTPVLAASGRWVVAVWTAADHERTNIYAATSADEAKRFGAPVRVNDVDGEAHVYGEDPPRVAIAPATESASTAPPTIIVTWPSDRARHVGLRSARSVDGGRTFLPSTSIGDETIAGERGFQSVTVGADRVARAAWLDGRRDPGTPPHTNVGGDYDPMHLMFAAGTTEGRWNTEVRIATNVCGCCKTAIATGGDGTIYVAFRNIYPGSLRDISFTVSHDGGRTFSSPTRVSEDHWMLEGCPDDGPTIALDHNGVVHIVWPTLVQGAQPAIGLFHASTRDGVTFTPRQRIETLGTPKPSHPQLMADTCGALTLVWDETQGSTRHAMMRQLMPLPSGDVRAGELLVISGSHSAVYPVVASTSNGLVAAWTDIDRSNGDRSDVALRPISLDATCEVPRDVASTMSITMKAIDSTAPTQRYTLRGRVASLDKAGRTVTVDGEAIPGFMDAMMMSYPVKNERLLDHVSPSDHIDATIVRVGDEHWLEDVKTSKGKPR
jgi:Cu/Ag efflux protein CusF